MTRLTLIDPNTATGEAKELLDAAKAKMGMVPNLLKVLANQPAALKTYLVTSEALSGGSFDAKTREALALTIAGTNSCDYCASAHSAIAGSLKVDAQEIESQLDGVSSDPKLQALLTFAKAIVETRGFVSTNDISAVKDAGYDDGAIVEVIANVAANTLTNYVNHVAQTEIDFPVVTMAHKRAA